ncbi:MAG: lactoylglutathione lyase [Verrucomicrobiaceae bacterium]|nr:MAG: lactoylglutathione lyase [Verrucomicrobiaceae bacterium]
MFRVKDPAPSLRFYKDLLGMTLLRESHFSDFSLYFLAHLTPEEASRAPAPDSEGAGDFIATLFCPVIELTHNHGTEAREGPVYHNGNDDDQGQGRGFGHVGFLVDDLDAACAFMEQQGVRFKKRPEEGSMHGLAFVYDPDNYWVEIIERGGKKLAV